MRNLIIVLLTIMMIVSYFIKKSNQRKQNKLFKEVVTLVYENGYMEASSRYFKHEIRSKSDLDSIYKIDSLDYQILINETFDK